MQNVFKLFSDCFQKEGIFLNRNAERIMDRLIESHRVHYDITMPDLHDNLKALCVYHQRDSQYVLLKRAELWASEQHEYRYIWNFHHLDIEAVNVIFQQTVADGEARIKPHAQHMCTVLTALVRYDSADEDALQLLKKLKKRKDYRFSLHGWMEFRIAAFSETGAGKNKVSIVTNAAGRKSKKDLDELLQQII